MAEIASVINWCEAQGWTDEEVQWAEALASAYRKRLIQVQRAGKNGHSKQRAVAKDVLLSSSEGVHLAVMRMKRRRNEAISRTQVMKMAATLNVWKPLTERVRVFWRKKSPGKYRLIVAVGIRRGAQQLLVRDMLSLMNIDSEYDYTRKGAGGERAFVQGVCNAMLDGHNSWWAPDIRNCFPSLTPKHFGWLPVAKQLLTNVIFLPKCTMIEIKIPKDKVAVATFLKEAYPDFIPSDPSLSTMEIIQTVSVRLTRQGLPQGSMLSPLIARGFIGRELRQVVGEMELCVSTIMDDMCIGACSVEVLEKVAQAVTKRFEAHPAGAIEIHDVAIAHRNKVFLLGYRLQWGKGHGDNPVHVMPHAKRLDRFRARLGPKLKKVIQQGGGTSDLFNAGYAYGSEWSSSQVAWTRVPGHSDNALFSAITIYVAEFINGEPIGSNIKHAYGTV